MGFEGSRILAGEEVYVLKDCPPAQSIGKTVMDKGYLFIWDPKEAVPYMVPPEHLHRCQLRVPRKARICASRVVEYVPQYDEEVTLKLFDPAERLRPIEARALPAEAEGSEHAAEPPVVAGSEGAPLEVPDDFDYEPSEPHESADEFYEELFPP